MDATKGLRRATFRRLAPSNHWWEQDISLAPWKSPVGAVQPPPAVVLIEPEQVDQPVRDNLATTASRRILSSAHRYSMPPAVSIRNVLICR